MPNPPLPVTSVPNFATWAREALEQFALEAFHTMVNDREEIERLRLRLRQHEDDWK